MALSESPLPDVVVSLIFTEGPGSDFDIQLQELFGSQQKLFKNILNQTTPFLNCQKIMRLYWKGKRNEKSYSQS